MNVNSVSLGLFEETREATAKICDAYGVPYEVLASQKGVTFANLKEAKKQMYEETMMPDVNEKVNAINNHIGTETMSWEIQAHFKHLPVFAEDQKPRAISIKQLVEALSKALADQAITVEQYQSELAKMGVK
jgi:phage portal protein BeeE